MTDELRSRQRRILSSSPFTVPGTLLVLGAAYALLPPLRGYDTHVARIVLALRWLVVPMLTYVAVCLLAIAPVLSADEVRLIPIAAVVFAVARGLYWWGYLRSGTLGRAPGVQATFTLNGALLALALFLLATR